MSTATLSQKKQAGPRTSLACMLHGRSAHPEDTVVDVDGVSVGGDRFVVIAGPCAVESETQMMAAAEAVREAGGTCSAAGPTSRGRARTTSRASVKRVCVSCGPRGRSPGLPAVSEVVDAEDVDLMERHVRVSPGRGAGTARTTRCSDASAGRGNPSC